MSSPFPGMDPYLEPFWRDVHHALVTYHPNHRLEYYPIPLQSRLPAIRIPLRPQDHDVVLRLQPLVEQAYQNGRYDDLDYRGPLDPPLAVEESAWAEEWLRSQGTR